MVSSPESPGVVGAGLFLESRIGRPEQQFRVERLRETVAEASEHAALVEHGGVGIEMRIIHAPDERVDGRPLVGQFAEHRVLRAVFESRPWNVFERRRAESIAELEVELWRQHMSQSRPELHLGPLYLLAHSTPHVEIQPFIHVGSQRIIGNGSPTGFDARGRRSKC